MKCYRVWMKDGYAGLYNAESVDEAKKLAVAAAQEAIKGVAMTARERREAVTVDSVTEL